MNKPKKFLLSVFCFIAPLVLTGCDSIWRNAVGNIIPPRDHPTLSDNDLLRKKVEYEKISEVKQDVTKPSVDKYNVVDEFDFNINDVHKSRYVYDLPATGEQNILIIPVGFKDKQYYQTEKIRSDIYDTFFGLPSDGDLGWESVASFYYKSSYGKLKLNGTVSEWYDCGYTTDEFAALKDDDNSSYDPTWTVLSNAVEWYKESHGTHCLEFDNNKDGWLDGVWLIYGTENVEKSGYVDHTKQELFWAYTYFNYEEFHKGPRKEDPRPFHYCWASFDFMYEGYAKKGQDYEEEILLDSHTYCHETGHLLGLPDYYVCERSDSYNNYAPSGFLDMMDANIIDHNAYSKMQFGWITPYFPDTRKFKPGEQFDITLKSTVDTGQCLILPTSKGWNGTQFDEYLLLEYYTPTGLNKQDSENIYTNGIQGFTKPGIRLSHVDSRLCECEVSHLGIGKNKVKFKGFTDKIVRKSTSNSTVFTDLAFSNTQNYNKTDVPFREWQIIDSKNRVNFDYSENKYNDFNGCYIANDSNLFHTNDMFMFSNYEKQFPCCLYYEGIEQYKMNNSHTMPFSFKVNKLTEEGANLTICYNI